jgi:hypothetical protein
MTALNWLLEDFTEKEAIVRLATSVRRQGHRVVNATEVSAETPFEDFFRAEDCVMSHCSIQSAEIIARRTSWRPGVFCNFQEYRCSQYYPALSRYLFNDEYILLPFGELRRRKEFIFDVVGSSDCVFVRPDSGFKVFSGIVLEKDRFEQDLENLGFGKIAPHELVVLAFPQNIQREWRLFATREGVVTGSQYRHGRKELSTEIPDEVRRFADDIAKSGGYWPDPVFSLDICENRKGELFLLEFGCFSCSGLYAADTDVLAEVVSQKAIEFYEAGSNVYREP